MRSSGEVALGARELVVALASAMEAQSEELAARVIDRLTSEIEEARDPLIATMQVATTVESLASIRQILQHRIEAGRTDAPATAIEYARQLAQRGVSLAAMERANRLSTDTVMRWCLEQMELLSDDAAVVAQAALLIMTDTAGYGDRVAHQLAAAYETERALWLRRSSISREACIGQLLTGRATDLAAAELTLGYRLAQRHLALAVWTERAESRDGGTSFLERSVGALAERLGCNGPPLVLPRADNEVWAWLAVGPSVDLSGIGPIVAGWEHPVTLAVGVPADGVAGFRRTHEQAMSAQLVAQNSARRGPLVVSSADVGAIALMCADMPAAVRWVRDILGPLAVDDAASYRLRQTIRVFLANGASYTATAEQLNMHKNSVVYRLRKAEDQLGHKLRDGHLDLEIALALCHWLGAAVLEAGPDSAASSTGG
ncbi:transposase-like protein [Rhodococcus sp. PvR044]|uniref:PucR family transcriptional regulator n=1 Tax=Rhodococcus TaxID=1827 RepID=UPI000BD96DC1|nr:MULTISPECIES: helix-turn-helix domain-containing protein [Rhodococcus]MBP1161390.1 transposase-like protein [Rhodococcus sp. PvR099]MCZ4555966.1 helix-turn-helix domain-containing protein [Rhodococcus maanshanensis]PTR44556.1 DNA-binding PucR family transcriptional regulator [Rhodococcus sp. OK611]SNX89997.1 DNA-binding transcriptional regulator, PucR family [Rhodococcus sp. OK270]